MSRALGLLVIVSAFLCALATVSAQESPPKFSAVDAPAGWKLVPDNAVALAESARTAGHFDTAVEVGAAMWLEPDTGKDEVGRAALMVTAVRTRGPVATPGVIRKQLNALRATPERASLSPGDAELMSWNESATDGIIEARMTWRHGPNETVTDARLLLVQSAQGHLMQVIAECVRDRASAADVQAQCDRALGSLTITLAARDRKPLAEIPAAQSGGASSSGSGEPVSGPSSSGSGEPVPEPDIDLGELRPLSSKTVRETGLDQRDIIVVNREPPKPDNTHKWLYLLGGLFLVVAFYATTRSRTEPIDPKSED